MSTVFLQLIIKDERNKIMALIEKTIQDSGEDVVILTKEWVFNDDVAGGNGEITFQAHVVKDAWTVGEVTALDDAEANLDETIESAREQLDLSKHWQDPVTFELRTD
jgi:hypothetical protein